MRVVNYFSQTVFVSCVAVVLLTSMLSATTVSVVIPCVPKHVKHLFNLISHYARQTKLPHEIIISLSEVDSIPAASLKQLTDHAWPFPVILIRNIQRTSVGKNRNLGTRRATGKLVLYQDADDIPHPQRVEIVTYFFENYDICHLMHFYVLPKNIEDDAVARDFVSYVVEDILFKRNLPYRESDCHGYPFHNGQPCILREIAVKNPWPEYFRPGEDTEYNRNFYQQFPHETIIVEAGLVAYRYQFGSEWKK